MSAPAGLYRVCTWWGRIPLTEATDLTVGQAAAIECGSHAAGHTATRTRMVTGYRPGAPAAQPVGTHRLGPMDADPVPVGMYGDLPVWDWGQAPAGYATRRQLRDAGLAPGGHGPAGRIERRRRRRRDEPLFAWLYRIDRCVPKRVPTAAQLVAVGKATAARRTCCDCGRDAGLVLPKVYSGQCIDCYDGKERTHATAA